MPKPYKDELYEARAYSVAEVAKLMGVDVYKRQMCS